ncbi:MAG: arsenite methyltransferase [Oscillospiraceae bacterium]|nr:arsenite methyltransferase [Oscillospiraceae bacterium]
MDELDMDKIHRKVQNDYKKVAMEEAQGCNCCSSSCCSSSELSNLSTQLGYSEEEQNSIPKGANMGLGCGNPQAVANIKLGETVLDLGSGGGFDCFLASKQVGDIGKVIGIDMTAEMISKARNNAKENNFTNVEFRLGEIENMPVANETVDVIISNCVINLSPNKEQVFKEAYRVLKNGGRLAISDIVLTAELPDEVKKDLSLYSACVSGASYMKDLEKYISLAGFKNIQITPKEESKEFIKEWTPEFNVQDFIVSANIEAIK